MADEEPVGYLGGSTGDVEDDPYVDPYADTADGGDDEVAGYLGGAADAGDDEVAGYLGGAADAGPEDLPALPGQQDEGGYSASDFIGDEPDPYADPYADAAADPYADPYAVGAEEEQAYDAYDEYGAAPEDDAAYFDSMGHEGADDYADEYAAGPATADDYPTETVDDYGDDDSPKTISQQDAESIIRRITTKRILPPESQGGVSTAPQRLTTGGGGLRVWPMLLVVLLLAGGGVGMFRTEIAHRYPALAGYLGVELKKEVKPEEVAQEDPDVVRKRALLQKVLDSELKAFGAAREDLKPIETAVPGAKSEEKKG